MYAVPQQCRRVKLYNCYMMMHILVFKLFPWITIKTVIAVMKEQNREILDSHWQNKVKSGVSSNVILKEEAAAIELLAGINQSLMAIGNWRGDCIIDLREWEKAQDKNDIFHIYTLCYVWYSTIHNTMYTHHHNHKLPSCSMICNLTERMVLRGVIKSGILLPVSVLIVIGTLSDGGSGTKTVRNNEN